ncbi:uncharacterized protein L201_005719 [Kwoniella dendrophila CBS 6074]|uniref:Sec20 C-terminal domain-containing protein n=1 Tax=Kwoniella dendrophila CBS 6074 TaxID=1295534 RepID=A0AAX4JZK8_9TREE
MSESLNSILSSLPRRLNDLESFQLPRLQQCLGPLDLHKELCDEMRSDLEGIRYNLDMAKEIIQSIPLSTHHTESVDKLHDFEQQYLVLKRSFRQSMLDSKRNILSRRSRVHELAEKSKSRYELDESRIEEEEDNQIDNNNTSRKAKGKAMSAAEFGMGGDDELQTKTNEVTTALRRTTALMQTELEKSVLSIQTLESSTQTLLSTSNLYDKYTAVLDISGELVKSIEKADFLDRIIIFSALSFFLLVVGFIIKRRIIDKTVSVVIGGVGKGLGWYLFGTAKLIKLAFTGKKSSSKSVLTLNDGLNEDDLSSEITLNTNENIIQGGNNINQDSAISPPSIEQDKVIGIDIGPGQVPRLPYDASQPSKQKGGKVEIIANDQSESITSERVKDEL